MEKLTLWSKTIKNGIDKYSYKKTSEPWRQQGKLDTDTKVDFEIYFSARKTEI